MGQIDRIGTAIMGASLIVSGYFVVTERYLYSSKYLEQIDFGQYHFLTGVLMVCLGFGFLASSLRRTLDRDEAARLLQSFVDISGREKEWQRFLHTTTEDPLITEIQLQCKALPDRFPPEERGSYTSREGKDIMRKFIEQLRQAE